MRCSACKGPAHPATGHAFTATMMLCGPCTRNFIRWIKQREAMMGHKSKRHNSNTTWTEAALTSIKTKER